MSIRVVPEDLLQCGIPFICHQVNCKGEMNSGVALQVKEQFPKVFEEYTKFVQTYNNEKKELLGNIQIVNVYNTNIVNIFAQRNFGYDGRKYTSYDAFYDCLLKIQASIPPGSHIAFPWGIGCGRGGADWDIIYTMICNTLDATHHIVFCKLDEKETLNEEL